MKERGGHINNENFSRDDASRVYSFIFNIVLTENRSVRDNDWSKIQEKSVPLCAKFHWKFPKINSNLVCLDDEILNVISLTEIILVSFIRWRVKWLLKTMVKFVNFRNDFELNTRRGSSTRGGDTNLSSSLYSALGLKCPTDCRIIGLSRISCADVIELADYPRLPLLIYNLPCFVSLRRFDSSK